MSSLLRKKFISLLQLRGFTNATIRNDLQAMHQFQTLLVRLMRSRYSSRMFPDKKIRVSPLTIKRCSSVCNRLPNKKALQDRHRFSSGR
jgi:hypothetical protein